MKNIKIFIGSNPKNTHSIIERMDFGLCINIFKGYKALKNTLGFKNDLFVDNGSFERFNLFLKGKINSNDYFDYNVSKQYFKQITKEYFKLLNIHNNNFYLTIPEVIGNSKLTINLQKEFLNDYKELSKKTNIIISLQFNPNNENWLNEVKKGLLFIKNNIPDNWIIGIPFGKDFKLISGNNKKAKNNFDKLMNLFILTIPNHKIHLFALGTINKIKNFCLPYLKYINSFDSSSVNVWSRNSHYLNKNSLKIMDIRDLNGKRCSKKLNKLKIFNFELDSNIKINTWINMSFISKFKINLSNFFEILNKIGII